MSRSSTNAAVELAYTDIGTGRPLMCLHGGMGIDARSLHTAGILRLAAHDIRLLIPDLRGHGKSRVSNEDNFSHATWVTDAQSLVSRLGLSQIALLGHSYGGFLALEYAIRWPHTLKHLILVGTSAGPVRRAIQPVDSDVDLRERFRTGWPLFFAGADKHWDLFDTLTFSAPPYNAAFLQELPKYDLRDYIGALQMPLLLIVGEHDWYLPDMEWLAKTAPKATLCILKKTGHFPFVETADEFVQAVTSFLERQ